METRQRALNRCLVPKLQGVFLSPVTVQHVCSLDQFFTVTLCWSSSLLQEMGGGVSGFGSLREAEVSPIQACVSSSCLPAGWPYAGASCPGSCLPSLTREEYCACS